MHNALKYNNMKVKKLFFRWLIVIFSMCPLTGIALETPALVGRISDYAMLLDGENIEKIDEKLRQIEDSTNVQIAILILQHWNNINIKTFANQVYADWKIGIKGSDMGILIIMERETDKIHIKQGNGLKKIITSRDIKWIIEDEMAPYFRKKQYPEGINSGLDAISLLITGYEIEQNIAEEVQQAESSEENSSTNWFTRVIYMFLWIILVYFTIRQGFRKNSPGQIFFFVFLWLPISFSLVLLAFNEIMGFWLTAGFVMMYVLAKLLRLTSIDAIWVKGRKIKIDLWNLDKKWLKDVNNPPQQSGERVKKEEAGNNEGYYGYLYKRKRQAPIWLITIKYLLIILFYAAFGSFILTAFLITGKAPSHFQKANYKTW